MDFAVLPPEVNSARMYSGPGSGPMLAAAVAWDSLAAALHSAASGYQSEIAGLTAGPWLGPSSAAMAEAAAPYVEWLRITASQAEQTANQARVAAAAYETAFAETVPPPVVTANRTLLAGLVATNVLGQNTPAIAATEAQYAEMWAQDAGAMYGYAGSAASATTLTAFAPPQQNSTSGSEQSSAVNQATRLAAGNSQNAVSSAQQAFAQVPTTLSNLAAAPAAAADPSSAISGLDELSDLIAVFLDAPASVAGLGIDSPSAAVALPFDIVGAETGFHTDDIISGWAGVQPFPGNGPVPPTPFPVITNLAGGSAAPAAAGLGQAGTVGSLSVPPTWTAAAPAIRPAALALPATAFTAAAPAAPAAPVAPGSGSLYGSMAAAGMAGRAMAGTGARGAERAAAAGGGKAAKAATETPPPPGGPITSIAAELRELASLRDAGIITEAEFVEQKQRLLPH
ncbi:hypothetical protein A5700_16990 [Mycobacterium sp. E1214]|uniref:PPE family protein, SVP subgroup n=1 Tax=Mycobacterium sp. E1214 TaxID=1834123 RepID=UPI000801145C|nr:PPE domain-containing protein [Mycobacterium sp. E1214]OBG78317.1 hypothetical protein A5700_16990 [Mycobacterium sp. E1214]